MRTEIAVDFQQAPAASQLVIDSEHRLRSENLPWDIDVWYPPMKSFTFPTKFLPLTFEEAHAILAFHDVSWRHAKPSLLPSDISTLKRLEVAIDDLIKEFPGHCAFMRFCGRSPKDGEPLNRDAILSKYQCERNKLVNDHCLPDDANTKMIAITRASTLKVCSGQEAMSLLLTSERLYSDILDWVRYGEPEQICLREWSDDLLLENEFRVFVHEGRVTAISQYDHYTYLPALEPMKEFIKYGIEKLWKKIHVMIGSQNYVVDIAYLPSKPDGEDFIVIEFSPFLPCTGASLFNWGNDIDVLEGRHPMEFRTKASCDIHPQLDDLIEINWDMRWEKEFLPYYHWFENHTSPSILERLVTLISRFWEGFFISPQTLERSIEPPAQQSEMLFVYGTLKKGFQWNQKYLSSRVGGSFVGTAASREKLSLVVGECGVPYVLGDITDDPSAEYIKGELWSVTPECLKNLDAYEGISKGYYSRQSIEVSLTSTSIQSSGDDNVSKTTSQAEQRQAAYIYVLNQSPDNLKLQPRLREYSLSMHAELYRAIQHIQIKQKNYYKNASTWGKTQTFTEVSYHTT